MYALIGVHNFMEALPTTRTAAAHSTHVIDAERILFELQPVQCITCERQSWTEFGVLAMRVKNTRHIVAKRKVGQKWGIVGALNDVKGGFKTFFATRKNHDVI